VGVINRIGDTARQAEGRIKEVAGKVAPAQEADDEGTPGEVRSRAAKVAEGVQDAARHARETARAMKDHPKP
jgi:uncharacterized protein YjbJ (UPF0337 family)